MNTDRLEACPCCACTKLIDLGRLPDANWFAGAHLDKPLPGGNLKHCTKCSLKFRSPTLSDDVYARLYDNDTATTWSENPVRADWDRILRYVTDSLPPGRRILDFGCYTGSLLDKIGARYERYGVELNRLAATRASQRIGQPVWASLDEIPGDYRFDLVIATDVVEHMANPMSLLQQLTARLADNGVLLLTSGDANCSLWKRFGANWWYCFYPEHVAFISRDWLDYVSSISDISVAEYETFRYTELGGIQRVSHWVQTWFYGLFPSVFLGMANLLLKLARQGEVASVPGAGITRDHQFVALTRAKK